MDSAQISPEQFAVYQKHVRQALTESRQKEEKLLQFKSEYQSLQGTLLHLPSKLSHKVMVPVGPLAFMPGSLVHTNEIMCLLGDNYFAMRTAQQASEIVGRRLQHLDTDLKTASNEANQLHSRLGIQREMQRQQQEMEDEGIVDIREELQEGEDGTFEIMEEYNEGDFDEIPIPVESKPRDNTRILDPAQDASLFDKLSELERLEGGDDAAFDAQEDDDASALADGKSGIPLPSHLDPVTGADTAPNRSAKPPVAFTGHIVEKQVQETTSAVAAVQIAPKKVSKFKAARASGV